MAAEAAASATGCFTARKRPAGWQDFTRPLGFAEVDRGAGAQIEGARVAGDKVDSVAPCAAPR